MVKTKRLPDFWLIFAFLLVLFLFPFESHAGLLTYEEETEKEVEKELTGFIPDGYKYYISHYWEHEDLYAIGFFRSEPVITSDLYPETGGKDYYHCTSSGGERITFFDFYDEESMLNYIYGNDSSIEPENCRIRTDYETYMRLDPENTSYYSNCDLSFSDTGQSYITSNPYSETVTETVVVDEPHIIGVGNSDEILGITFSDFKYVLICIIPVLVLLIGFRVSCCFWCRMIWGA